MRRLSLRPNDLTVADRYPIPQNDDLTQNLHAKNIFTTIDHIRAYYQMFITQGDIPKIAITTPFGVFEYPWIVFGLSNAAQACQCFMNIVLRNLDYCYVYIDDLLLGSISNEEYKLYLKLIVALRCRLERQKNANSLKTK